MADGNFSDVTVQLPATAGSVDTTGMPSTGVLPGGSDTGPLAPGQTFGPRYHIIRLLGIGGMGAVYHAWDTELNVSVAIKVIRPEIMANPSAGADVERRFKRELVLARQVTHKNVVRIHDLGEIDQIKYITMSYVNGVDLATRIKEHGKLPVTEVVALARAIVSGLVAAHGAGVVHRDLKPANIMIGINGDTLIMDFGIARSSGGPADAAATAAETATLPAHLQTAAAAATVAASRANAATIADGVTMAAPLAATMAARTATGTAGEGIVGTVQYMAPEQARGLAVDQRADIYAFGLILYDVLAGFGRHTSPDGPVAELRARMEQAPPSLRTLVPEVPEALDKLVARCLDPLPEKRFQTTIELESELALFDDNGELIPVRRVFGTRTLTTVIVLATVALGGAWWYARSLIPPKQHEPVTVLVADLKNSTSDAAFDHTLEPMLRRALESAGFISAYDRTRIRAIFNVAPPEILDGAAAREIALKQGVGVVVSGAIDRRGTGYEISVQAAQTVTGKVIASARGRASNKDQVLDAATKLVTTIRKSLGDETSDSAQLLAMKSLSTTSMGVAGEYAAAIEAQSNGKFDDARQHFLKTVELDPNFGLGYQGLAIMSRNLGKLQEAEKYNTEALSHLQGMTDRERFAVRASYYMNIGDSQQCVKEYGELIAQYAADAVAHNNRALCMTKLRNMREAVAEMRQAVKILPTRVPFRGNLAVYAAYANDFQTAVQEASALQVPTDLSTIALAFGQLGQGLLPEAAATYEKLRAISARGASWAASGIADLALYEGRFSDAVRLFEQGAASDLAAKNSDKVARKLTSLAYAHLMLGQKSEALAAAEKALAGSNAVAIRFLVARIFVETNAVARARTLATGLSAELPAESQAYGKIIEGEIALKNGDARQAIKILTDAGAILDTWWEHVDLGRAYLELRAFPQADSEFDRAIKRRGEALSLLVDEEPTSGYFPSVYYYQGLAREGLKNPAAAESYRTYLTIRGRSKEDPLLPDVLRRVRPS
jgi:serine/threonine protein kinase/tetratricopeptide (TPR) repeat protein